MAMDLEKRTMSGHSPNSQLTEAPVTLRAYLTCAFAALGGIFFGYDSGYISGVMGMEYFIHEFTGLPYPGPDADAAERAGFVVSSSHQSLIVSILSAGTFMGAFIAGDLSDRFGRRTIIITGCGIFLTGVTLQTASSVLALLVVGRLVAGLGVGFVSAIIVLYMSEIAPRKIRGTIVSGYQLFITLGMLLASCINYGTQHLRNSASYRIPIALQMLWAIALALGLFLLPESPRYLVKQGQLDKAALSLSTLRSQPVDSIFIQSELADIINNYKYEQQVRQTTYIGSWIACFKGSIWDGHSNIRRTILGTTLQMMSQWTGVNFVFYYGTVFFQNLGTIKNVFLITLITTLVNVCSTPLALWAIEKFGRRALILYGAAGMVICQYTIAIVGTILPGSDAAMKVMIAFICVYIFFFASTWGPATWTLTGEVFPLSIRSRGIGMSIASNWLWNCIIAVITPYMVGQQYGNLGPKVFFVWGSLCVCAFVWGYFLVPETKGLSLEQIELMMKETIPRKSGKWILTVNATTLVNADTEKHKVVSVEVERSK